MCVFRKTVARADNVVVFTGFAKRISFDLMRPRPESDRMGWDGMGWVRCGAVRICLAELRWSMVRLVFLLCFFVREMQTLRWAFKSVAIAIAMAIAIAIAMNIWNELLKSVTRWRRQRRRRRRLPPEQSCGKTIHTQCVHTLRTVRYGICCGGVDERCLALRCVALRTER